MCVELQHALHTLLVVYSTVAGCLFRTLILYVHVSQLHGSFNLEQHTRPFSLGLSCLLPVLAAALYKSRRKTDLSLAALTSTSALVLLERSDVRAAVVDDVAAGVHRGHQIPLEVVDARARAVVLEDEVLDVRLDVLVVPSTDDNLVVGKLQRCQLG